MFVNRATIGYNETDSTTNRLDEGYNKTEIFQNEQNQSQNPNSQLNTSQILCLFCLSDKIDSIPLHGETDEAQNARNIIAKYFWFDVNHIDGAQSFACSDCWAKVMAFHEFYLLVEAIHQLNSSDIDEKNFSNISFHSEYESTENLVKSENVPLEFSSSEYNAVFIPTQCDPDESNRQLDKYFDEMDAKFECKSNENLSPERKARKLRIPKKSVQVKPTEEDKLPKGRRGRRKKNIQEIICYMCSKQFRSMGGLRFHLHVHDPMESQTYECDVCKKKFSRKNVLTKHKRTHSSKLAEKRRRKTSCPICKKELTCKSLKTHILTIHENKQRPSEIVDICEVCGKEFKSAGGLSQHALTHLDRKSTEVQCDICNKWLKNRYILNKHKLASHIQTSQKCPHCDKIKPNSHALTAHILRVHSAPKHHCTHCTKSFTRLQQLREHIATHTGESLYDCPYCDKKFRNDGNKYKHMREQHLDQWSIDRVKKRN